MEMVAVLIPQFECSYAKERCFQKQKCSQNSAIDFNFELGNPKFSTFTSFNYVHDFFASGDNFGSSADECWLAFFPYDGDDTWYLGTVFMQKYYTVFDLSPYTTEGQDTLQIGLAFPNSENPILTSKFVNPADQINNSTSSSQKQS